VVNNDIDASVDDDDATQAHAAPLGTVQSHLQNSKMMSML